MGSPDAQRRLFSELTNVFDLFGINYTEVHRSNHPAFQFEVAGKRILFPVPHADGSSQTLIPNMRSKLRNIILSAGGKLVETPPSRILLPAPEASIEIPQKVTEPVLEATPVAIDPPKPEPVPESEVFQETPIAKLNTDTSFLMYQPKVLAPGKVIVIELDHDLVAEKGQLLVIPLHRTNFVMPMSRQQFDVMFEGVEIVEQKAPVQEPVQEPEVKAVEEMDPVEAKAWEDIVEPAPEPVLEAPTATVAPEPVNWWENAVVPVQRVAEGVSGLKPPKRKYTRREQEPKVKPENYSRTLNGLSAQAGRILISMAYLSKTMHRTDLTPSMFNGLLSQEDRKQYASRMITLIKLELAERGLPLPNKRGWHNKLTPKGFQTAKALGTWPWTNDGLPIPKWMAI